MTYAKQTWVNGSSGGTPVNATRLSYLEDGVAAAHAAIYTDEYARDAVAGMLRAGSNVTFVYDDTNDTFTINSTVGGAASTDVEAVRDAIGAALVGGTSIQILVNDTSDTITISLSGVTAAQITDATSVGRSVLSAATATAARTALAAAAATHTHATSDVTGLDAALTARMQIVAFGTTASTTRPSGAPNGSVYWVGSGTTLPTNALSADLVYLP